MFSVWAENQINEEIDYDVSMKDYDARKEFWKNEVLRINDLPQNEWIGGLVFVPINKGIEYLEFSVPIGSQIFTFLYKKVVVK